MSQKPHLDALLAYVEMASLPWLIVRRQQLGLYYLAQHACDAGFQVRVDNLSSSDHLMRRLARILDECSCHLLGLYVDQENLWDLRRILPSLKNQRPGLDIVLGGPQLTADPELTLERLPQALCGVIGEGEEAFVELLSLDSLDAANLGTCKGLVIRTENGIIRTPPRRPIEHLDVLSVPQRRELTIDDEYPFSPTMITGRGCPGRCAFCYEGRQAEGGKRLRLHSVQRCLEEFRYLNQEFGHKYICIVDDTFVADTKRLRKFCQGLIAEYGGRVKWFCEARVDTLARHPDLLPLMIESGLIRLQVGGESGCQRILDLYHKGTTLEQMYAVVDSAKSHGLLSLYANFIVGGAFETRETFELTRDFALELLHRAPGCVAVGHSFFTPYPGTPMYETPGDYGIEIVDKEVVTGDGDRHVFCRTDQLSRYDIIALGQEFDDSVRQAMKTLCQQLPREVIERHFQAYYDWALSTEWQEALSKMGGIYGYFKSVHQMGAKTLSEAKAQDFSNVYPARSIELVTSNQGKYAVRTPRGLIHELDTLDHMILELSAGKLSFEDVVGIVSDRVPKLDSDTLRETIIERYANFDNEFLVVWKTDVSGGDNRLPADK